MFRWNAHQYGPITASLLEPERVADLGPGGPDAKLRGKLAQWSADDFGRPIADGEMARACHSGLWLYHDFLDESHRISQDLTSPTGSYWHAIMHRREPDAGNSKYWFRRVAAHPVLDRLVAESAEIGYDFVDPYEFVDHVESVRGDNSAQEELLRKVQLLEWRLLFDYCFRRAVGIDDREITADALRQSQ